MIFKNAIIVTISVFCSMTFANPYQKDSSIKSKLSQQGSSGSQQSYGGATSGGGDEVGLEVSRVVRLVSQMVEQDKAGLYTDRTKEKMIALAKRAKILIVDGDLPTVTSGVLQRGAAFSYSDGQDIVIRVQRDRWKEVMSPLEKDKLIHHELAVMAGAEATGQYHLTEKFSEKQKIFWEKAESRKFLCSFSLFEKQKRSAIEQAIMPQDEIDIGESIGSVAFGINFVGAKNGRKVIHDFEVPKEGRFNRAIVLSYVIGSNGYLRAMVFEASVNRFFGLQDDAIIAEKVTKASPEITYYSPHDLAVDGADSRFGTWNGYYTLVSCKKL